MHDLSGTAAAKTSASHHKGQSNSVKTVGNSTALQMMKIDFSPNGILMNHIPGADIIQRASVISYTNVNGNGDINQGSIINAVNHYQRVGLRPGERGRAAVFGAGGIVCNHHAPYHMIANAIIRNHLLGKTVVIAISSINNVIDLLNTVGAGFNPIPHVRYRAFHLEMTQEFDDAIANIANDPRNLFYAPVTRGDSGGTQLDWPSAVPGGPSTAPAGHHMFLYSLILAVNNML